MANHVNSGLCFRQISEAGVTELKKIYDRFDKYSQNGECHLGYVFTDDISEMTIGEASDLIGAKWGYVQDYDEFVMTMYSAWRQPEEFVEYVVGKIAEVDDKVIAVFTYEDEMPNFIGVSVYTKDGLVDGCELDDEELREELFERYPDLAEQWDEEEEEWKDDGDLLFEYQWEFIDDWQTESSESMLKWIREDING
jgi:hypothetical protein